MNTPRHHTTGLMADGCISLAKFDPIVAKISLKTSAISAAEEIGSLFTLISEIFRTLPYVSWLSKKQATVALSTT